MKSILKHFTYLLLLVTAMWLPALSASAIIVTELVDFVTPHDNELNQFGLTGTLNTLAQGLGAVDCGSTEAAMQGYIRAAVTIEDTLQFTRLVSVEFLGSSFQQENISLFYDVPNTTRRVTFSTNNLGFGVAFDANSTGEPISGQFSTIPIYPGSFDMVQNGGSAKIEVTNRPPVVQSLLANPATSIYGLPNGGSPGYDQGYLTLYPPTRVTEIFEMVLELPLDYQQVVYTGTGLPVTLNYSGSLTLYSTLPRLTINVPEPSAFILSCLGLASLLTRRFKRTG